MQGFGLLALLGVGYVGQILVDESNYDSRRDCVDKEVLPCQLPHSHYQSTCSFRLSPTAKRRFIRFLPINSASSVTKIFFSCDFVILLLLILCPYGTISPCLYIILSSFALQCHSTSCLMDACEPLMARDDVRITYAENHPSI